MNENKIVHFNLNFKAHGTIKVASLLTKEEILTELLFFIKPSTRVFTALVNESENNWVLFNLLKYLYDHANDSISLQTFVEFYNTVLQYFGNTLSNETIVLLWLRDKLDLVDVILLKDILKKVGLDNSFLDEYKDKIVKFNESIREDDDRLNQQHGFIQSLSDDANRFCASTSSNAIFEKKTVEFGYDNNIHSTGYLFDHVKLMSDNWDCAFFNNFVAIANWKTLRYDTIQSVMDEPDIQNRHSTELLILNSGNREYLRIQQDTSKIIADLKPFDDSEKIVQEIQAFLRGYQELLGEVVNYRTLYLSGYFEIPQVSFNKYILQDVILNDEILHRYFQVNELEKANKFNTNTLHLISDNTFPLSIIKNEEKRAVIVQFSKCSSEQESQRIECMCRVLMGRYAELFADYLELYKELLPIKDIELLKMPDEGINETESEKFESDFANKYKVMLRKTGYKTACRPKTRIPYLITKEEAKKNKNQLEVLEYPRPESDYSNDLNIPVEYFRCADTNFKYPGISSLGGGNLYVPCCFNKNPRSSNAFLEYYFKKGGGDISITSSSTTEHIKGENQIIKKVGDLGRLYQPISQLCSVLFPSYSPFRVGVPDRGDSLLLAISFLLGISISDIDTKFHQMYQEMPYLTGHSTTDMDGYINPRKYLHLLQCAFNVNIIIFTKGKGRDDPVDLLNPCLPDHKTFYRFQHNLPFIFILEHWGSSPDRYTKRKFPISEPVAFYDFTGQTLVKKTVTDMIQQNCILLNNLFSKRFQYSNQNFCGTINETGILWEFIKYQSLDSFGRLRGLVVEYDNIEFYLEVNPPLPPLPIKQTDFHPEKEVYNVKQVADVIKILSGVGLKAKNNIIFFKSDSEFFVRVHTKHGLCWTLKTGKLLDAQYETISTTLTPYSPYNKKSDLNQNEKIARVLMDYVLYILDNNPVKQPSELLQFVKKHIIIDSTVDFGSIIVNDRIDGNPSIYDESAQILRVPSKNVSNKLYFYLLYHLKNMPSRLNNTFLPQFYKRIEDFQQLPSRYICDRSVIQTSLQNPTDVKTGAIYLKNSLSEWTKDTPNAGFWYYKMEIPSGKRVNSPILFHKISSVQDAYNITWMWTTTKRYTPIPLTLDSEQFVVCEYKRDTKQWVIENTPSVEAVLLVVYILFLPHLSQGWVFLF